MSADVIKFVVAVCRTRT